MSSMNEPHSNIWLTNNQSLANETTYDCAHFSQGSPLSDTWFQTLIYFLYTSVFFIALLGNALVCYVVYKIPKMQTVTNYFIVNLAVGDILMDLFCVPTSFISTLILQYWPFGAELCPSVNYSQAVSVLVSAYTLVAISVDRYIAIMYPLRPRVGKKHAKFAILVVWLLALIISFPILVVSRLQQPTSGYKICDIYVCEESWPPQQRYYYSMALMILQYLMPLLVLVFTYTSIAIMVWGKTTPGEAENTRDQRMARSKRKMIKMMMTVVIAFTICWLPFNVLILIMDLDENIKNWPHLPYVWTGLHWLSMSHACYNPVIYCWMNSRFRSSFYKTLRQVPLIERCVPDESNACNTSIGGGIALTGFDGQNHSGLRRINTCTTYVSVRRKTNSNYGAPPRSASFKCNNSSTRNSGPIHRNFIHLEVQPEESM